MENTAAKDRAYFNARAHEWDKTCVHDQGKVAHIISLMDIKPSDRILDVGTGTGVLIPHLSRYIDHTGHIVAVDVSEKMLEVARHKFKAPNITYRHGDVLEMPMDEKFDLILCFSMFPHFKENKQRAIATLSQLLKTEGSLCICHAQSRKAINALHIRVGDVVGNDRLEEMSVLNRAFIDEGLHPQFALDNEEYFIISGKRKL